MLIVFRPFCEIVGYDWKIERVNISRRSILRVRFSIKKDYNFRYFFSIIFSQSVYIFLNRSTLDLYNWNFYHCTKKKKYFQRKKYFEIRVANWNTLHLEWNSSIVMYFFFQMYAGYVLELSNFTCGYHCTEKCTCYEPLGFIELAEKFGEFSRMKYVVFVLWKYYTPRIQI